MMYTVEIAGETFDFSSKKEAFLWVTEMSSRGWGPFKVYPKEPEKKVRNYLCPCGEKVSHTSNVLCDECERDMLEVEAEQE